MKKLLLAILALLSYISASAQVLSDSQIEVEKVAIVQGCLARYRPEIAFTQRGFEGLCRCSADIFFKKMPANVAESSRGVT